MQNIIEKLRTDLSAAIDPAIGASEKRFFKEPVKMYGIKVGSVIRIAKQYWQKIRHFTKPEIFALCEELLKSDYCEEAYLVAEWLPKLTAQFEPSDLALFETWIDCYINNWAKCDSFCNHTVGSFIEKYPESVETLKKWAHSPNRWMRRAAAVSLVLPARHGKFLADIFEIADILLLDKDDMVQKGYGWMLKEAAKPYRKEVLNYVLKHKAVMPRTALRYAIEQMPPEMRAEAMSK